MLASPADLIVPAPPPPPGRTAARAWNAALRLLATAVVRSDAVAAARPGAGVAVQDEAASEQLLARRGAAFVLLTPTGVSGPSASAASASLEARDRAGAHGLLLLPVLPEGGVVLLVLLSGLLVLVLVLEVVRLGVLYLWMSLEKLRLMMGVLVVELEDARLAASCGHGQHTSRAVSHRSRAHTDMHGSLCAGTLGKLEAV